MGFSFGYKAATPQKSDRFARRQMSCVICLECDPSPIRLGCACRSDAGVGHVACFASAARVQRTNRGTCAWWECQICKQAFSGEMRTGLASVWVSDSGSGVESYETVSAGANAAAALDLDGRYADAERVSRDALGAARRVLGEHHGTTISISCHLAKSLARHTPCGEQTRVRPGVRREALTRGEGIPRHARCDAPRARRRE